MRENNAMASGNVIIQFRAVRSCEWRRRVELARVALGIRATTIHVPDADWVAHQQAGMNPAEAVLAELLRVA